MEDKETNGVPRHVAVIMDGNGRWAQARLLPRSAGHREGVNRMVALSEALFERGVEYCTFFALSTENFFRPREELQVLFFLFRSYFKKNIKRLKQKSIALRVVGDLSLLPEDVAQLAKEGERATAEGTKGVMTLALGYGGRQDILHAVNEAVRAGKEVTLEEFSALLYTSYAPDPDLLIRTGREVRLSNFLLWQSAYTELYFTDTLFPDFTEEELEKALGAYRSRKRRFGRV